MNFCYTVTAPSDSVALVVVPACPFHGSVVDEGDKELARLIPKLGGAIVTPSENAALVAVPARAAHRAIVGEGNEELTRAISKGGGTV